MGKTLSDEQIIKDFMDNLNKLDTFVGFYRENGRIYGILNCKKHGQFRIVKNKYQQGRRCPKCGQERIVASRTLDEDVPFKYFNERLYKTTKLIDVYQKVVNNKGHKRWFGKFYCEKHCCYFESQKEGKKKKDYKCEKCAYEQRGQSRAYDKDKVKQQTLNYIKKHNFNLELIDVFRGKKLDGGLKFTVLFIKNI